MMIAGYWTAAKAVLQGWKFWLLIAVWAVTALYFYQEGKESCQDQAYKALEKELKAQEKKAAAAVKQAAKDQRVIEETKKTGEKLREQAKEITSDDVCVPTPERVRHLDEVQRQTEH